MTLEKAIETLTELLNVGVEEATPDVNNALRLGIEALKEVKACRSLVRSKISPLLPGETKED